MLRPLSGNRRRLVFGGTPASSSAPRNGAMGESGNNRLDSWKEIAAYVHRDITTVIRWKRERGLPVYHVPGGKRHAVFAYAEELDAWLSNGWHRASSPESEAPLSPRQTAVPLLTPSAEVRHTSRHYLTPISALAGAFVIGALAACSLLHRPPVPKVLGYRQLTHDGRMKVAGIVTDGARVYFAELTATGSAIVQVSTSGGESQSLSTFFRIPLIQDLSR